MKEEKVKQDKRPSGVPMPERLTIKALSGLIHLEDSKESTVNKAIKKLSDYEDFKNSDLPWCANCKHGKAEEENGETYIYCNPMNGYCLADDFCGAHEWATNGMER